MPLADCRGAHKNDIAQSITKHDVHSCNLLEVFLNPYFCIKLQSCIMRDQQCAESEIAAFAQSD